MKNYTINDIYKIAGDDLRKKMEKEKKLNQIEKLLFESTYKAGKELKANAFSFGKLEWKKTDDPVTELDKKTEKFIKQYISSYLSSNFIGEEYGYENNKSDTTWIIDPIDGTKSFTKGDFLTSVSVAVEHSGKLIGGCVYDFMRDIMYFGFNKKTCMMHENKIIENKKIPELSRLRVAFEGKTRKPLVLFDEHKRINPIKRCGSIALNMAQLAFGNYEAMITTRTTKSNPWDIAAGYYLLHANGFYLRDHNNNEFDYMNPVNGLVAINPKYVNEIKKEKIIEIVGSILE